MAKALVKAQSTVARCGSVELSELDSCSGTVSGAQACVAEAAEAASGELFAYVYPEAGGAGGQVEILRDSYGVPHVYADGVPAVMYGFGYAQAEDHLLLMADFYLEAQGELAVAFADDDPNTLGNDAIETTADLLLSDRTARLFRVAADVDEQWAAVDGEDDPAWDFSTSDILEAFAAGVNRYVSDNTQGVPSWVPDFTAKGVLAMAHQQAVLGHVAMLNYTLAALGATSEIGFLVRPASEWAGSNQFAVSPAGMADGQSTVVLAAPHQPFYGHTVWYEAHLSAGPLRVAGATFYGLPVIPMAHNERIAFSETSNAFGADGADVFEVQLGSSGTYLVDGNEVAFEVVEETVALASGGQHTHTLVYANLGGFRCPVIEPAGTSDFSGRTMVRTACTTTDGDIGVINQILKMDLAQDLNEFRDAMRPRHINMWNFAFGSVDGDIYYLCNSRHPDRVTSGQRNQFIDGSDSSKHWQGILPFEDLPQVATDDLPTPPMTYFQNCNNSPGWITNSWEELIQISQVRGDLCSHDQEPGLRPRRMLGLLEGGLSGHTYAGLQAIATDSYLLAAEWTVPLLEDGYSRLGADPGISDPAALAAAMAMLSAWDLVASVDSRASTLFHHWGEPLSATIKTPPENQVPIPDGQMIAALNLLSDSYNELITFDLSGQVPVWGDVHRIARGGVDLPQTGSESWIQALHPVGTEDPDGDGIGHGWTGSSYLMLTQMGPAGVYAQSMKPWGQSDDPLSAHYNDLTVDFSSSTWKEFWFDRADVEANLESTTILEYTP